MACHNIITLSELQTGSMLTEIKSNEAGSSCYHFNLTLAGLLFRSSELPSPSLSSKFYP